MEPLLIALAIAAISILGGLCIGRVIHTADLREHLSNDPTNRDRTASAGVRFERHGKGS